MYFAYGDALRGAAEYQGMLEQMKKEVLDFHESFQDDPRFLSGWGHAYFCDEDGGRLIYNRKQPFRHICSICRRVYEDFGKNSCHVTMYRNEAVITALKAAILYQVFHEKKYLDIFKNMISYYADNYKYFAVHAKEKINASPAVDVGGAGRIMPQGLNEAIIAIRFLGAMEVAKDSLEKEWVEDVKAKLFAPVYELLLPQKMKVHNIPVWLNSAFGMMGLFFGEEEWLKEATERPYNLFQLIREGVTESGFWYEGSIHYNFFALEGVMNFLTFAEAYGYEVPQDIRDIVFHMLTAAYDYAFDNDRFPNPSDGWPNINLKTYSYIYYMGYKVFGEKLVPYIRHIEDNQTPRTELPLSEPYYYENRIPLVKLMYAPWVSDIACEPAPVRKSFNFESSNCAVLRNDSFNVFLKYGHQTKSHAHPDKMNIEIMMGDKVLTKDLSNSGYASRLCNGWHRKAASHNTCVINGQPCDINRQGHTLSFSEHEISAEVEAYDGVSFKRSISLEEDRLKDAFEVECKEESIIDYFFHFEDFVCRDGLEEQPVQLMEEYEYIFNVKELQPINGTVVLRNKLAEMKLTLEDGMHVYLAETYNNPANTMRDTLILRKQAKTARFQSQITAIR